MDWNNWAQYLTEANLKHPVLNKPRCACDHGPDDICANGAVYTYCSSEWCGGACSDEGGRCLYKPGCCNYERDEAKNA